MAARLSNAVHGPRSSSFASRASASRRAAVVL
jgi:hypothetical protein